MIALRSSLCALSIACLLNACSDGNKNSSQAPLAIGDSFIIRKTNDTGKKSTFIGIKKDSLEKEFLLQGEVIRQPGVAQFRNLKSRIVMFRENNGHLNMMEAIDGHSSSSSIPQNIVLAQFKILSDENGVLFFDFSEGMSKIFIAGDWYASDASGTEYKAKNAWTTVELGTNYIEKAEADIDNNLVIRQIAQIKSEKNSKNGNEEDSSETVQVPVEVKYYISPYHANEGFVSRESPGMQSVGFFEIAPRLVEGGGQKILAARWDERKPVTYWISENTPSEYIQAIKDGVLYWNKAFGKEVLRVAMAPKGVTAPNFHYNLIQWVDWKDAGYAYADAQMDPRTGEILHASVFLTSVFGFSAKNKARQILRRLHFEKSKSNSNVAGLTLAGFQQKHLCDYDLPENLSGVLTNVLSEIENGKLDESALLKIAQDTVRETVAHEVGHTLGLRHNFAGSLSTNISNNERDSLFSNYLKSGKAPENKTPSSTLMDYQQFQEALLTGDQLVRWNSALEYDSKAIQQLYFDKRAKDMPLFCTDSHVGKYIDCAPFDFGPSVFEFAKVSEEKSFETLPFALMEYFIAAKSIEKGYKPVPLSKALPSPVKFALKAMAPRLQILKALSEDAQFLKAERGTSGDDNTAYLKEEIAKGGGLSAFLAPNHLEEIKKAENAFQELVDSDVYTHSEGAGGPFEFTAEDKVTMKRAARLFFSNLPLASIPAELALYKAPIKFRTEAFGAELAQIFAEGAAFVLETSMGTISADVIAADGSKVKLEVPRFFFSDESRKEAAAILNDRSDDLIWGYKAKAALRKKFKALVDASFKHTDFEKIAVEDLPDELGTWVLVNRQILEVLKQT